MSAVIKYVVGFRFCEDNVLLIKKTKPEWQKGRINGIGGKVEPGEESNVAMAREFLEETAIETEPVDWKLIAIMSGPGGQDQDRQWSVRVYTSSGPIAHAQTTTVEEVIIADINNLPPEILFSLKWLIPLCQDPEVEFPLLIPFVL